MITTNDDSVLQSSSQMMRSNWNTLNPLPIVFDAITDLLGNKLRLTMDETLYKLKYTSNDWYYVGY